MTDEELWQAALDIVDGWVAGFGGARLRVAATQTSWARRRGFAVLWSARRWLGPRGAPVVLSVYFQHPDASPRWKQVVEVRPGLWAHHLEVREPADLDQEVRGWVESAYGEAG